MYEINKREQNINETTRDTKQKCIKCNKVQYAGRFDFTASGTLNKTCRECQNKIRNAKRAAKLRGDHDIKVNNKVYEQYKRSHSIVEAIAKECAINTELSNIINNIIKKNDI